MEVWGVSSSAAFPTTCSNFLSSLSAVAKPLWYSKAAISHHNQMYIRAFPWQSSGARGHARRCMLYAAVRAHGQGTRCHFTCGRQSSWWHTHAFACRDRFGVIPTEWFLSRVYNLSSRTVFFLVFFACLSAVNCGDHLLFGMCRQPAACPNAQSCSWLGGPEVDASMRCGSGQTGFHLRWLLLCFMWPAVVRRGIQTRTTNGSDVQPCDIKPTREVSALGSYLFKVLLFGSSCLPTSVFHGFI